MGRLSRFAGACLLWALVPLLAEADTLRARIETESAPRVGTQSTSVEISSPDQLPYGENEIFNALAGGISLWLYTRGETITPGFHIIGERVVDWVFSVYSLNDPSFNWTCPSTTASYSSAYVHESTLDGTRLRSLAADVQLQCGESGAAMYVEIRYNSELPFTVEKPAGVGTPNPFAFPAIPIALPSALETFPAATIVGSTAASSISITGGEYSVNGGAFTSAPGEVLWHDHVTVRVAASATPGGTATATLTVGGLATDYIVRTYQPGEPITAIWFEALPTSPIAPGHTGLLRYPGIQKPVGLADFPTPYQVGWSRFPSDTSLPGAHEDIRVGLSYGNTGQFSTPPPDGCDHGGRAVVFENEQDANGNLIRFAANVQQTCGGAPAIFAEIRFNSTVPLTVLVTAPDSEPDPFAFRPASPFSPSSTAISHSTMVYGVNVPVPISIAGGEYSVNGGPWMTTSGAVQNRDQVRVRVDTSDQPGQPTAATLTIGTNSATFIATTRRVARPFHDDFDDSGTDDLVFMEGTSTRLYAVNQAPAFDSPGAGWSAQRIADFDGDGKADLLWRDASGGATIRFTDPITDQSVTSTPLPLLGASTGWEIVDTPDFDGDGGADLLFVHADGSVAVWLLNGRLFGSGATILGPGTGWRPVRAADFDGDGKSDILWKNDDGRHAIWLMDGLTMKSGAEILGAGSWTATHAPDLDGDGMADIIWRHADGTIAVWLMNGLAMTSGAAILGPGTAWSVQSTGDFDNDGRDDLLWSHPDGSAGIWLMDGTTPVRQQQVRFAGDPWRAKALIDINGDSKADIVWQDSINRTRVWIMEGTEHSDELILFGAMRPVLATP
jgi:VCBS repeat protein